MWIVLINAYDMLLVHLDEAMVGVYKLHLPKGLVAYQVGGEILKQRVN